ncbi:PH domain-containing protein [Corynebacterium hansenii]|uniref:PH domain-containing protein n=1 Tax=Corynebacterium hansenii TaxID=394964 RepID=A0ABV7ZS60_9CORY|nr:PH domain-containing protein [Corynebacterium hansenii]WJZ00543.1 Bacterial membrane flanked domain protein [Corynebacterium hansenii]
MTHPEPRPAGPSDGHGGPIGPGRRRVHPLTPLLAGARALAAIIAIIAFNVVQQATFAGDLIELATGTGPLLWLSATGISVLVLAITAVASWVSWRHRFFELADDEVRIGSGWLIRSRRTARFDRVQAVDVNQPLLARLAGLGEVKVETAGGDHSDLTIRFLPLDDCRAVRAAVLEAKRDTAGDAGDTAAGIHDTHFHDTDDDPFTTGDWGAAVSPAPGSATVLHGPVPPPRLFGSAIIGPGLLLLALPVVFVGAAFAATTAFGLGGGVTLGEAVALAIGAVAGTSFIGIAVFFAGIVASAWQRWNKFHGFTLSADDAAGRLHISAA